MQVPVDSVIVKSRVRKELGDIESLKKSISSIGQLSPVVLTRQNELISGYRRLTAARELAWQSIEAVYVDRDTDLEKLQMELEENVHRKDFTPEEILEGYQKLDRLKKPKFGKSVGNFFKKIGGFFTGLFRKKKKEPVQESSQDDDTGGYSSF